MPSPYITSRGKAALTAELEQLRYKERPEIVKALSAAAAEGDRSENAEYQYRKKQLRELDRRIRFLMKRSAEWRVVDQKPANLDRVYFGAYVTLFDHKTQAEVTYQIVGSDEADLKQQRISVDTPVAKRLLGRSEGESIEVTLSEQTQVFDILSIAYDSSLD